LVHSGTLYAARDPVSLRAALSDLCREEEGFADSVELILAGRVDEEVAGAFTEPPLDSITRLPGYLAHAESLKLLRSADLCLLLVGEERLARGMLTGKLFEYLGSETPILAIAPDGEATELIERCRAGDVFAPDDVRGIKEHLRDRWKRFRGGDRQSGEPDAQAVSAYTRRNLTERLATLLDEVSASPRSDA
jgi:glycosyltransferase involved in cell wall biosynthesis